MWVEQRVGPFPAGVGIVFPVLRDRSDNYRFKYVRIGIQAPQSPYVTETRSINYTNSTNKTDGIFKTIVNESTGEKEWKRMTESVQTTQTFPLLEIPTRGTNSYVVNNTHCFKNGINIEDEPYVKKMHKFSIGTSTTPGTEIRINEGEIIEFPDMGRAEYFKVYPLQDEDAYTIIEIQYLDTQAD